MDNQKLKNLKFEEKSKFAKCEQYFCTFSAVNLFAFELSINLKSASQFCHLLIINSDDMELAGLGSNHSFPFGNLVFPFSIFYYFIIFWYFIVFFSYSPLII